MQVPTRYGWVLVTPYMTLVAAYERLIGGRGTQIRDEPQIVLPIAAIGSASRLAAAADGTAGPNRCTVAAGRPNRGPEP
jgi:hypothetical protein